MSKINVTRSSMAGYEEYCEEIKDIWESHWLTNAGPKHMQLQESLASYLGVKNLELFVNGHTALEIVIQAMGLSGEVITTPFTFASTTHAIVRNGLKPVFCDINKDDFTIDTKKIESLITEKTSAIIPVHVYGNVCNIEEIDRIAKKHNLKVIYDAAHAFGVEYNGKGIGNYGDAAMFSFHATKVYNTIEGGAVTFSDSSLGEKLCKIRNFGLSGQESVEYVGSNAKMNEFAAAMGICNLRHIDEEMDKRRLVVERYIKNLQGIKGIRLNLVQKNIKPNYAYFPIIADDEFGANRDEVLSALLNSDIAARKYFYPITSEFECYKNLDSNKTPTALEISKRVLTLPLYSDLRLEDVDRISDIIINCKK